MIYVFVGLVAWTIISFWFFFSMMGYKYRKGKWYDWPLLVPFFVVVHIATVISTLFGWNK